MVRRFFPFFVAILMAAQASAQNPGRGTLSRGLADALYCKLVGCTLTGFLVPSSTVFASLGTPSAPAVTYCSDCTATSPCAGSGSGALARREGSAWNCGGSAGVTSVGLAGTANQITVTGSSPITTSGSWTLSFPGGGVTLPATTTGTFSGSLTGTATKADALNSATTVVNVSSATAPTSGQVLTATSGTAATWQTAAASGANTALSNLASVAITADLLQTSTSATAFLAGPNGATNPGVKFDFSTASAATGLAITPKAAGAGVVLSSISSGTNEDIVLTGKGTGQVQITNGGTAAKPALTIAGASGTLQQRGMHNNGQGISIDEGGGEVISFAFGRVLMKSGGQLSLSSDSNPNNADTRLTRCGVACWHSGDAASATPVDQAFRAQYGSGTNISGAKESVSGGAGTGTGAPGDYAIQSSFPLTTGTTTQSFADRVYVRGNPKTLTETTATAVADVSVPSGTVAGGTLFYTIEANDGTDFEVLRGSVPFEAVNKAGTLTTSIGTPVEISTGSSGVLTETPTITTGTNKITLNISATSTLVQTVLRATYTITLDGGSGVVSPL